MDEFGSQQNYGIGGTKERQLNIKQKNTGNTVLFSLLVLLIFSGCGLLDDYYLPQLTGTIQVEMNNNATIPLPNISSVTYPYFTNFVIYYRIYISNEQLDVKIDSTNMGTINSALLADYNSLYRYTDTTNTGINITSMGTEFRSRRYYELELENRDIDKFLSGSGSLYIGFPLNEIPYMELGAGRYNLFRSTGRGTFSPGIFSPLPEDRYFRNATELYDSANAYSAVNQNQNADVADKSGIPATPRFTYVSLYILAAGFNPSSLNTIYSRPTFIGVFKLPEINL